MFNSGTAIGPAVAGLIYAWLGPAWCFTVNGFSFIAVIGALLLMRLNYSPVSSPRQSALKDIKAGLAFVASDRVVLTIIISMMFVSLFGISFVTLVPAWAVKVLGGDATTNGLMQSARGVGALIGALLTAALSRRHVRGRMLTIGTFVFPLMLLLFASINVLWLSLLVLVGIGLGFMVHANNSNSLVQTQVPDELRGRVMSIFMLTFQGMMPIGGLVAGIVAERVGEPLTVACGASILVVLAFVIYLRVPELRRME
jgi:MFS family permease